MMLSIKQLTLSLCSVRIDILICCVLPVFQHDLTPRIYVLHKITIALKFMSYINQKLRPSYQTALNLQILKISGRSARERAEQLATGGDH